MFPHLHGFEDTLSLFIISHIFLFFCTSYPRKEGINMASYVAPELRKKFETLSVDLKNIVLERNVRLNNIYDLIAVLEDIVNEGEGWFTLPFTYSS